MLVNNIKKILRKAVVPFRYWFGHTSLPGFKQVYLREVWQGFLRQLRDDNIIERAAAISFNFAMALPSMTIFLFTLIPFFPINKAFVHELFSIIHDIIPGERNFKAIKDFLDDFLNHPRNGLLSLGFVLSVFFSSNAMMGLMRSFDKNMPGFIRRNGFQKRGAAIKLTIILMCLFFVGLALLVAQGAVLQLMGINSLLLRAAITNGRWIFIVLLFFCIISFIYRYTPSKDKRWRFFTPGSLVATLLVLLFAFIFSWWVSSFGNYNKLYGSIGTLLIILITINLNALAILIGFEINVSVYAIDKAKKSARNAEKKLIE